MNHKLIDKYVSLPLAIQVFKQDREVFKDWKMHNIYLSKIDSVLSQLNKDYYELKKELITKHHLDVKRIDSCTYSVNKEIIEYTPDKLKSLTEEVMREYLYGENVVDFELDVKVFPKHIRFGGRSDGY